MQASAAGERRAVAIHEAGHAVAALLVAGGRFLPRLVTIDPAARPTLGTASGITVCRKARKATTADRNAWAVVVAAGAVAERSPGGAFHDEDTLIRISEQGWGYGKKLSAYRAATGLRGDAAVERFHARSRFEARHAAWRGRIESMASQVLSTPLARKAIRRLARILLERGTVAGERAIAAAAFGVA